MATDHRAIGHLDRARRSELSAPVPLTILTGLFGAGKTTLLNHILTGDHGLKVGILVNNFGSINVDAELVVDIEDGMVTPANGCVCCQIRDDLVESVAELIDRNDSVEYVILNKVDLAVDRHWGEEPPQNRVVAIAHNSTATDPLTELLEQCVES